MPDRHPRREGQKAYKEYEAYDRAPHRGEFWTKWVGHGGDMLELASVRNVPIRPQWVESEHSCGKRWVMEANAPPRTWRRAKWAWKLFQAQRAQAQGDFTLAIGLLDEAASIKVLWAPERVQRAMLLLQNEQVSDAQKAFAALWKEFESSDDPDLQYLRRYCRAMLEMIRGEASALTYEGREARGIPCKPRLRQRFPLLDDEGLPDQI